MARRFASLVVDLDGIGTAHRTRAISDRFQSNAFNPAMH